MERHLTQWTQARASFTLRPNPNDSPKWELEQTRRNAFVKNPEKDFRDYTTRLETVLADYRKYDDLLQEYESLAIDARCSAKLQKVFKTLADDLRKLLYPKDTAKWRSWQSPDQLEAYINERKAVLR